MLRRDPDIRIRRGHLRFGVIDYDSDEDGGDDKDTNFNFDRIRIQEVITFDAAGNVLDGTTFTDPNDSGTSGTDLNADDRESVDGLCLLYVRRGDHGRTHHLAPRNHRRGRRPENPHRYAHLRGLRHLNS